MVNKTILTLRISDYCKVAFKIHFIDLLIVFQSKVYGCYVWISIKGTYSTIIKILSFKALIFMLHHSFSLIFFSFSPLFLNYIYVWPFDLDLKVACTGFFLLFKVLFSSQISVDKFHWPVFKLIIFSVPSRLLIHPSYLYFCYHNFSISIGLLLVASVFLLCSPLVHIFFMLFPLH